MPSPQDERAKVFVSYSRKDGRWLKRLQVHLKDLERRGLVELWDDTKLQTGTQWRDEINRALDSARAAILLISADFIASDFIANNELPPLLARAEENGVVILPLILSPSRFEKIESLSRFMTVNPPSEPLIELSKAKQERYLVKLGDDILRAIEEAQKKPVNAVVVARPKIFSVPFSQNKFFTGRDEILNSIYSGFKAGEAVLALNGMPGIGKTQTALEYAYRYQQHYQVTLWGNAYSREVLVTYLASLAGLLDLPVKNAQDQGEAVNVVKRWLEDNDNWLLILDNADDLAIAREFIPSRKTGHVLLTTRAQYVGTIAERITIEKMLSQEGALFLLRRLNVKKDTSLESGSTELATLAEILSRTVDGLPLALDQAAAFIGEMNSTLEEYLHLFQIERARLLAIRGEFADGHFESVAITFSLAFKKVVEANLAAADILRLCAFLEADAIPEEIFSAGAEELGDVLRTAATSPLSLTYAIREAGRFSLLRRTPEAKTLSLHRLVQAVLIDEMDEDTELIWAERAVRAVSRAFPTVKYVNWQLCSRLIPHVQSLTRIIDKFGFEFPEVATMVNQAGQYLGEQARYEEAELLHQRALAIREKVLGPKHPVVAASLNNLAVVYHHQIKYEEAEPLYQRALAIREESLGAEHWVVAQSLNNLAGLYHHQGKYEEAGPLYQRALAINEKVLGPAHPDVATSLDNLAVLYKNRGRYEGAEQLYQRALAIREESLGAEHPDVAQTLNNLAGLYHHQGKYEEAEPLYQRAVAIREKVLGPEHPDVATSLNNLAVLYKGRGRYEEAEPLYQRALAINEKLLGPEHQDVATSLNNLAVLYKDQGKYVEAEPLYQRALAVYEKVLGPDHPVITQILNNLAVLYDDQGKYAEAELLHQRVLAIREESLGAEHPDVAQTLNNLAALYDSQRRYEEAEPLYQRALAINEKSLGAEHPVIATNLDNLAKLYDREGKYGEAESLYQRALAIGEKALGLEHPIIATCLNNLAGLYHRQGKYAEAEPLYQRALAINEKVLGPEHPDVATILENFTILLRKLNREFEVAKLEARGKEI